MNGRAKAASVARGGRGVSAIITLTMNPAIDVSMCAEHVAPVHKLRCTQVRRDPGGGGINVARVVTRLGGEVTAMFTAGGLTGRLLERLVDAEGVRRLVVPIAGETREDFTVLDQSSGQQFRFVTPGPRLERREWTAAAELLAGLEPRPRYVCASGSLPPGVPDDFYARIARAVGDRDGRFVLDTSGAALKAALAARVWLIKPSLAEMETLAGAELKTLDARVAACRKLVEGGVGAVALTLGAEGALLVTAQEAWRAVGPPVAIASTVGAGDSFLGCLLAALSSGAPMDAALRQAVAGGGAALLAPGTELCLAEDVRRLLDGTIVQAL